MDYGICLISVAPLRSLPDDKSELVTQLLFGERVHILEKREKWFFVQITSDSYQGWVSSGQLSMLDREAYEQLEQKKHWVSSDLIQVLENKTRKFSFLITAGSSFYDCKNNSFELCGDQWFFHGNMLADNGFNASSITQNAMLFQHTPYLWGGKSALGIDCSGFTQLVFKMSGMALHRDASQQATQGEMVNLIHEAREGDLLFFDNEEGDIIHTGIFLDNQYIIHAHQQVRIDKIDHYGIFNVDTKKYTHQLRLIKRVSA